ncbi:MAG TPA: dihydroorotase [Desulfotomaculum sp.]|nr:MAG: Dihydroorotase [Desulfotomaculum sp. 46_80]KUK85043.1 MAG: Dihydroorotase [Desulfofundulus kuznetsovii]HAG10922.1 dihydroorotase [Desulfotomaculum sp.]HBY03971.1 dihydroorotase [Desulfotomaculum sp.]
MKLLIKRGTLISPDQKKIFSADVLIADGKIAVLGNNLETDGAVIIDADGKLVLPGLIDLHAHLREPGFEDSETIAAGTMAAARGGFTSLACMPNTNPVADNSSVINYILNKARQEGRVNVFPIGAITVGSKGEELAEMAGLKEAGAVAFSDDGRCVSNAVIMFRAMQYARMIDMPVIAHCEDTSLSAQGSMHEGYYSTLLGLKGIPAAAEEVIIARDLILAKETGCRLHIAHVSTAGSVQLIRQAKAWGLKVTAEATPHHFTLTDREVTGYNTNTKVNPPLRTQEDLDAVRQGLRDGTIDVIATDHAPHAREKKEVEYENAPFGISGLETAVGLVWTELVNTGILSPLDAVEKMTINPARILGISKGVLAEGADADLTVIDPARTEKVDPARFVSKGRNTPFAGRTLTGIPVLTIVGGKIVFEYAGRVFSKTT